MKKYLSLLLIVLSAASYSVAQTNVKKDPEAKKILDKAKAKFKSLSSFKADFTQQMENKRLNMKEEEKGSIKVKGDMFRVKLGDTEIIVNGTKSWTILKEDCETNEATYEEGGPIITPGSVVEMYETGYKYIYMGDQNVGGTACYSIDLEPDVSAEERDKQQVTKIRIYINKSNNVIKRWKIYERNGNQYTYSLDKFTSNPTISDTEFEYSKKRDCSCCELIKLDR